MHSGVRTDVAARLLEVMAPLSWEEVLMLSSGSFRRLLAQGTQLPITKKALSLLSLLAHVQVTNTHSMIVEAVAE